MPTTTHATHTSRRAFARLVSTAAEASSRQVECERIIDERAAATSRRDFMRTAGFAGAALAASPLAQAAKPGGTAPRIAIVGAGLAGLTCAYRLKQAGIAATVYEANTRLGGRCWTRRGDFLEGQIAEHGGELIDQSHTRIRQLAQRARACRWTTSWRLRRMAPSHFLARWHALQLRGGDRRHEGHLAEAASRSQRASYATLYNNYTQRGLELDNMSIADWINETVPGGMASRLGQLLDVAYNIGYRRDASAERAEFALPARLLRPGPAPSLRTVEREVSCGRRQPAGYPRRWRSRCRSDRYWQSARRRASQRGGHLHAPRSRAAAAPRPPSIKSCSRCPSPSSTRASISRAPDSAI